MTDSDCVAFLQWALPRMQMRWPGFHKVRRTVCKRVDARLKELGLADVAAYRARLETTAAEWPVLDSLCGITISRFYRDRAVFDFLAGSVLPEIARHAHARGEHEVRAWSCGCACGEEAYTLAIAWRLGVKATSARHPSLHVVATDTDAATLERARAASYGWSSVKDLPSEWRRIAFDRRGDDYWLRPEFRGGIEFLRQDVRKTLPDSAFHLILCRNLVFTYFDDSLQRRCLPRILARLIPGGAFVIGKGESLPSGETALEPWSAALGIYRHVAPATEAAAVTSGLNSSRRRKAAKG